MQKMILAVCLVFGGYQLLFAEQVTEHPGAPVYQVGNNEAVKNWLLSDPIPLRPQSDGTLPYLVDFFRSAGGERNSLPTESTKLTWQGQQYGFTNHLAESDIIDLAKLYPQDQHLVYAFCYLESEQDQDVYLHMGSDDGYTVYLNHVPILEQHGPRGARKNADVVAVHLQKGKNPLLIKNHNGNGGWGFVVEVLDLQHHLEAIFDTRLRIAYTRSGRMGRQLSLSPYADHSYLGKHPDLFMPVNWRILDAQGTLVGEKSGDFFSETHIRLPAREGLYEIAMELPTLNRPVNQRRCGLVLAENLPQFVSDQIRLAEETVDQEVEKDYAGWIAYAKYKVKNAIENNGIDHENTATALLQLSRALADARADVLNGKTGRFEWAYYSQVDGTGQPFRIGIPEDHDPQKVYPLVISLHGAGGRHMAEQAPAREPYSSDKIRIDVLGRARYGMYQNLSEVDILECLAYVRNHWLIDSLQIHIEGGSMGGGGVFKLASRFPQLFATGILSAGFGTDIEVENLLHIPLYSLHSADDPTVSITSSRTPLDALSRMGGEVVKYETDGLQHAIWQDEKAFAEARAWREGRQRVEEVRHIRFTAVDELAKRAYWAGIEKWGPLAHAAGFEVLLTANNELRVKLDNVGILALDLARAPVDRTRNVSVYADGQSLGQLRAPLPSMIYLQRVAGGYRLSTQKMPESPQRQHFTGGLVNLYHGEPLLIVWGTQGDNQMDETLQNAALTASRCPGPAWWPEEAGEPLNRMLYGQLRVKSDLDVTPEDLQKYNLLLLGTPQTNLLVARMAGQLPVKFKNGKVELSDGLSYDFQQRALGLLYYNPLAPARYIYLAASDDPAFYAAGNPLMGMQTRRTSFFDFTLLSSREATLVSGRHFQPDWQWEAGYATSGLVPDQWCLAGELNAFKAEALMQKLGSQFVVLDRLPPDQPLFSQGESRWMDVIGAQDLEKAVTVQLRGREILEEWEKLQAPGNGAYYFYPTPHSHAIDPERVYNVCFPTGRTLWYYQRGSKRDFRQIELTEISMGDALADYEPELSNRR